MSRHDRLQIVAGTNGNETAGFLCEEICNGTGILPLERYPRQDEGSGVDILPPQPRQIILEGDEAAQGLAVDGGSGQVRSKKYIRFKMDMPAYDLVTTFDPFQFETREDKVARSRSDIDTDAGQLNAVLFRQLPMRRGKSNGLSHAR